MRENSGSTIGTYSNTTKGLFAVGIPIFVASMGFSFWSAAFDSQTAAESITLALLGLFFAWLLYISFKVFRFIRCRIIVQDEGIKLTWPTNDRTYSWRSLSSYRNRQVLQIVEVFDRDNNRVLVFDYHLVGFNEVYSFMASRLPARA